MTILHVGEKVKVVYVDQLRYIFQVEVTGISRSDEFTGRVQAIFGEGDGEMTGGNMLKWNGQEMTFSRSAIVR